MKKLPIYLLITGIILCLSLTVSGQDTINSLKEKIIDIQNKNKPGFRNFTLCSNIIGYGQYIAAENAKVKVGSEIIFYYEPINLFTNRQAGGYHVWYTQDMILLDASGKELYNGKELLNFNYNTTSPVMDFYAKNSLSLGQLPPGKYIFKAVLHDKLKREEATYKYTFEIVN